MNKNSIRKKRGSFRQMIMSNLKHSDISEQSGCRRCTEHSRRRKGKKYMSECKTRDLKDAEPGGRGAEFQTISFWIEMETR